MDTYKKAVTVIKPLLLKIINNKYQKKVQFDDIYYLLNKEIKKVDENIKFSYGNETTKGYVLFPVEDVDECQNIVTIDNNEESNGDIISYYRDFNVFICSLTNPIFHFIVNNHIDIFIVNSNVSYYYSTKTKETYDEVVNIGTFMNSKEFDIYKIKKTL